MGRSPGFVSNPRHSYALFRLAFATAPGVTPLTWRQRLTRWLILQKARGHTLRLPTPRRGLTYEASYPLSRRLAGPGLTGSKRHHSAPTACRHTVSGSFHSPNRGSFHLSLTVLVHYRSPRVFSLGRWSSPLPTGFPESRGTQGHRQESEVFRIRGYHPLWQAFLSTFLLEFRFATLWGLRSNPRRALQPPPRNDCSL